MQAQGDRATWLTTEEVAEQLRVNVQTVRIWCKEGRLPTAHLGSRKGGYRIQPTDLAAFLATERRAAGRPKGGAR